MSGHSKWSTIKRKKEVTDKARAVIFSKLSRIITSAVIEGGGVTDPAGNVRLASAIEKARAVNMPKNNIERAIDKAKNPAGAVLKEIVCEGFGKDGILYIITATTDNPNRAISNIKSTLEKLGGKMGHENSVKYQFVRCGVVEFEKSKVTEEQIYNFADQIGAIDIEIDGDYFVYIPYENVGKVSQLLDGMISSGTDVIYKPLNPIVLSDEATKEVHKICETLEELDDVDTVYTNISL